MQVKEQQIGKRLDLFLSEYLQEKGCNIFSRNFLTNNWEGLILVNGKSLKPSYKLREGDHLEINDEKVQQLKQNMANSSELKGQIDEKLQILFENSEFLIIEKESGVVVHPGVGNSNDTLANYVKGYLEEKGEFDKAVYRGGLVHRLDKGVSGLMVFAKNLFVQKHLQEQFEKRQVKKIYLADIEYKELRRGMRRYFSNLEKVDIDEETSKLEKNNFEFDKNWLKAKGYIRRSATNRVKMEFKRYMGRGAKEAVSYIKPVNEGQVLVVIKTGRMHQIRATLEYYGIGIKGDTLYGSSKSSTMPDKIGLKSIYLSFKEIDGGNFTIIKY